MGGGDDLPEIEIEGEDAAILCDRLVEDLAVRQPLQALLPEVNDLVPLGAEPLDHAH